MTIVSPKLDAAPLGDPNSIRNDVGMTFNDSDIFLLVSNCCVYDSEKLLNDFEMSLFLMI